MTEETQENFLIVSHSNRLKELINTFGPRPIPENIKRIENCGILLLTIIKKNEDFCEVTLELLDMGGGAAIQAASNTEKYTVEKRTAELLPNIILKHGTSYNFFIVRHGEGDHNIKTMSNKMTNLTRSDPSLTSKGIEQAKKAGRILKKYFEENKYDRTKIIYFVSILQRTHQTLLYILSEFVSESPIKSYTATILPKSEEFSSFGNPGKENTSLCINNKTNPPCSNISYDDINLTMDWSFYNNYSKNSGNMISLAIQKKEGTMPLTDNSNFGSLIKDILHKLFTAKMSGGKYRAKHRSNKTKRSNKTTKKR